MTEELRGILTAAEHYIDDDQMRTAIAIHTAGLDHAGLVGVIEGLSGFVAAAYQDLNGDPDPEDLRAGRREAIDIARAALAGKDAFRERFARCGAPVEALAVAACHVLATVAGAVSTMTADQVLTAVSDVYEEHP
ncbi:hypothetical protein C5E45_28290 [Nocardia nova]|uniref:Uncharacterized protein n=1 Tax=Nocardia nova TaxID=37330 RepID=A0A2S6AI60_9NOCA|nr:hypothetical protein [Nocardia nova]PPJ24149.1 hypothetical protein C5E41_22880 [Nocardia nova]PPJ34919.1 hypothetical protein C5E45_28290 [Nocardia nova]